MLSIKNEILPLADAVSMAVRGMRNSMNSWSKSDSCITHKDLITDWSLALSDSYKEDEYALNIGENDLSLMRNLSNAGSSHRKFMRMIPVYCDITAPLYWWKEMDTYRMGVEKNSCSTMHKIHAKPFTLADFSNDMLTPDSLGALQATIDFLNEQRERYLETNDKQDWYQLIQLLPSSYNQMRTMMFSYEALHKIYHERRNHKLNEWHTFCDWIETMPLAKEIICE